MRYYLYIILSVLYLLNFTFGVYEVPDNLPIVGNVDEFAASALLLYALQQIRRKKPVRKDEGIALYRKQSLSAEGQEET